LALHVIQQAIEPDLQLEVVLNQWNGISAALREANRSRQPQIGTYSGSQYLS
jgi:hypothetical protein